VAVFSMLGKQLLMESYINFDILGQEIALTIPLSDRYQRTAECRYQLNNGELLRTSYTLKQGSEISQDSLIAYAFFESIRIGADASAFLCEELSNSIEQTRNFLGEFLHVIPTESPTVCLLVYKKTERLYDVRKFTVTIENEKITDILG
jgi:hypothetical protein